jgi:DNA (cytosine-5)-methyltransferase 1
MNDQSRATAWCVIRWMEALMPPVVLIENVKEFRSWGPIGSNGRPIKSRASDLFRQWVNCAEALGYRADDQLFCAADYGDPTTRTRLFIQFVRGHRRIVWPEPTHAEEESTDLLGTRRAWRSARDHVIDWSLKGKSVYERERPLAEKTMARIYAGYEMGGGDPYLIHFRGTTKSQVQGSAKSLSKPLSTITTSGKHHYLVEPYLVQLSHGNGNDKNGNKRRVRKISSPLPTVCGKRGDFALCEPYLIAIDHNGGNGHYVTPVGRPIGAITTKQRFGLVEPYLINYNRTGSATPVTKPVKSVTTKERFGLVQPVFKVKGKCYALDFLFRLLQPHELARAQGFPGDYKFEGNKTETVKQIGNAVPCGLAEALVLAVMTQNPIVSPEMELAS